MFKLNKFHKAIQKLENMRIKCVLKIIEITQVKLSFKFDFHAEIIFIYIKKLRL